MGRVLTSGVMVTNIVANGIAVKWKGQVALHGQQVYSYEFINAVLRLNAEYL